MTRPAGTSVRVRLTLSYAAVVVVTGVVLLGIVWLFLLRYVPAEQISLQSGSVPNRTDLVRAFVPRALTALVVLLVAGLLGGWVLAGRVLAPLTRLRTAARLVGTGSFAHRVRLPGRDDEFRQLADAFDTMLDRLEAHVEAQERFAANASHELRTPLAITRTVLEVAGDDPDHDHRALVAKLLSVNARAVDLTEALLVLGQSGRRPSAREPVDLSLAAEEATETLLPLAEARGIVLEVTGTTAHALGVPALLLQLVTNLVHNAIVHNVEPTAAGEPRLVRVATATEVLAGGSVATLVVENTGPVLAPAIVATLTEPFQRGTARVHQDQAGAGLGLAIVDAVVRAHEGSLRLDPREGGGLVVTVRLPGAGTPPTR
ncbi:two-component sensor histidine kinase [Curtobacterium sp. MCJR17_055]|uniref:sensor histidine kinase n=1 Tax=unclassified Curtobacterium TaxID=257496 RepID=UPI000D937968|nr:MULTISPECIES: HAMP domain-containing sensor histidine kinase [unclassified Curtobacterium]PYY34557.1 two-component sensor histidine kinase [Curtobacterium sp. MCBD17_029]PYY57627.1 two-component sensor histidine kinase [Curtobacterium sp. MCPF17_015]PYY58285.1 two-component sensor histidine kinase [Curtobacterium sp. MCJR17_055]